MVRINCCCRQINLEHSVKYIAIGFIICNFIQALLVIMFCSYTIDFFNRTTISLFMHVDITSSFISVILLCFIIIAVAWATAVNNSYFSWLLYYICMLALLVIEIILAMFASNIDSNIDTVNSTWVTDDFSSPKIQRFQEKYNCCGFLNTSLSENCCDNDDRLCVDTEPCYHYVIDIVNDIRTNTAMPLFYLFLLGVYLCCMGVAICMNPNFVTDEFVDKNIEVDKRILENESDFMPPLKI